MFNTKLWQGLKQKLRMRTGILMRLEGHVRWVGIVAASVVLFVLIFATYRFQWTWTGFNRSLWDWMQLLIIPITLTMVAMWFNRVERKNEQALTSDNQQASILQAYLDTMSNLLLKEGLRKSEPDAEVRIIARTRTLSVLQQVDGSRKRSILQFLYESGLIYKDKSIISLDRADLSNADLNHITMKCADLRGADLSGADLLHANLRNANLREVNFYEACLVAADLGDANLSEAGLIDANLRYAHFNGANLNNVNFSSADLTGTDFEGAILTGANFTSPLVRECLTEEQLQQITLVMMKGKIFYTVTYPDILTFPDTL